MGVVLRAVTGLVGVVVAGAVGGCGDAAGGPTGPGPLASPSFNGSASSASTETRHSHGTFDGSMFVPCANGGIGELVILTGTYHSSLHETVSSSGNVHIS